MVGDTFNRHQFDHIFTPAYGTQPSGKPSTSGSKERSTEKPGERFVEQYGVRTGGKAVELREK